MLKILALDPSGTGKTGICLIDKKITFQEFQSPEWKQHYAFISQLVKDYQPQLLLYENTNYINSRGKDMTSLLKLIGAIESLELTIDHILVSQVKDLKKQLFKGAKQITGLEFKLGMGWFYQDQKLSLHQLDALLVYQIWKERQRTCFESSRKEKQKHA